MTREEREQAISEFNSFKEHGYNHGYLPSSWSIEMAIQALEQSMPTMVYPQVDGITPTVVAQADGEKSFKMRDATPEEQKSVDDYIKSISKPTGINFWDLADGDLISRTELLKAIDTWDKYGCDANTKLVSYQDHRIPYIHYDDVIKCIKGMPSVKLQEPTDTITMTREEFSEKLMKHYRQGRADEKAYQNGEIMQSFNPD